MEQKKIVICSTCGQAYGKAKSDSIITCEDCGGMLVDTGIPVEEWRQKTPDEKNEIAKKISDNAYEGRVEAQEEEEALQKILITSGYSFEGYSIKKYSGYISGDDVVQIPRGTAGYLFGRATDPGDALSKSLVKIRRQALKELKQAAYDLGCNAIIGVDFDYITLEPETANKNGGTTYLPYVFCVTANGNAVVIEKNN